MRKNGLKEITIGLVKRKASHLTELEPIRSLFDQIESQKYELQENDILLSSNYLVTSPTEIKAPRDIKQMLSCPHRHLWKSAIYEQYDKNHRLLLLSVPFSIDQLPEDSTVLKPVLV